MDEAEPQEAVSLVIAIQSGRSALFEFQRMKGISAMLDQIVSQAQVQTAIVVFDSDGRAEDPPPACPLWLPDLQPARNSVVSFKNRSSWSWCTQWPALGTFISRQCCMALTRGSFSGTGAKLSSPQKSSVGEVIWP